MVALLQKHVASVRRRLLFWLFDKQFLLVDKFLSAFSFLCFLLELAFTSALFDDTTIQLVILEARLIRLRSRILNFLLISILKGIFWTYDRHAVKVEFFEMVLGEVRIDLVSKNDESLSTKLLGLAHSHLYYFTVDTEHVEQAHSHFYRSMMRWRYSCVCETYLQLWSCHLDFCSIE